MEFTTDVIQTIQADDAESLSQVIDTDPALIHQGDSRGLTLLHYAALAEASAGTDLLITRGAQVDPRNKWGNTPLWVAVMSYRGDKEVISALLRHGADPDAQNNYGRTPRQMAHLIANYDVAKFFTTP